MGTPKTPLPEPLELLVQLGMMPRELAEQRNAFFDNLADAVQRGELTLEQAEAMGARLGTKDGSAVAMAARERGQS